VIVDTGKTRPVAPLLTNWLGAGHKEAVAKALGTGWQCSYTDIEIRRQPSGAPAVHLHRQATAVVAVWGEGQWQLSLSHDGNCDRHRALICSTGKPSSLRGNVN